MGVYMVGIDAVQSIPVDSPYGFDTLMLDLLARGKSVNVRKFDGYWLDIGRPDDYVQAIDEFELMRKRFLHD